MEVITLQTAVEKVPRVGTAYAKRLKKFGIKTVQDLLFYFPARYDDFSDIISIDQAKQKLGEVACVQGEIIEIETDSEKSAEELADILTSKVKLNEATSSCKPDFLRTPKKAHYE